MDIDYIKRVGIKAAYNGASVLLSYFGKDFNVEKKGPIDLVTDADIASEKAVIATIKERFPDHGIYAEESGGEDSDAEDLWIIDPLDGTTNFAHNINLFCISIAFLHKGEIEAGVVLNPSTGELFTAVKNAGAQLNGHRICVSEKARVSESLLVTGFPYNLNDNLKPLIKRFENCLRASMGVRRLGSAALDLCFVACGRFSGFWEENLKPWDTAAGMLIAAEAGATVTDFNGAPYSPYKNTILATNGRIHKELQSLLEL